MYTAVYNQSAQPFDLWSQKEAIEFAAKHWAHLNPVQSIYPASIPAVSPEWSVYVCFCGHLSITQSRPAQYSLVYHTRPVAFFLSSFSLVPFFLSSSPALLFLSHLNPCRTTILPPTTTSRLTSLLRRLSFAPQYGITLIRLVLLPREPFDKLPTDLGNHEERVTPRHPRLCLHLPYHHHNRSPGPIGIVPWATHCDTESLCRYYRRLVGGNSTAIAGTCPTTCVFDLGRGPHPQFHR